MKTSNKILLIAAGCMFALVLLVVIIYRFTAIEPLFGERVKDKLIPTTNEKMTKSYDLNDFTELVIAGSWEIKVKRADTYQVTVTAPANVITSLNVNKTDKTLNLGNLQNIRLLASSQQLEAEIALPILTGINASGAAQLELKDFTSDKLTLNFSGAGQLISTNNHIAHLVVECSGAADMDLSQSTVKNADLNVSGAAQIKLNMDGGKLAGQISGLANVTYSGKVQIEEVKTYGMAKVTRRD